MTSKQLTEKIAQLDSFIHEFGLKHTAIVIKRDKLNKSWFAFKFQKIKAQLEYDRSYVGLTLLTDYRESLQHKLHLISLDPAKKMVDHHEDKIEEYIKKQITDRDKK